MHFSPESPARRHAGAINALRQSRAALGFHPGGRQNPHDVSMGIMGSRSSGKWKRHECARERAHTPARIAQANEIGPRSRADRSLVAGYRKEVGGIQDPGQPGHPPSFGLAPPGPPTSYLSRAGGPANNSNPAVRLDGFRSALEVFLEVPPPLIRHCTMHAAIIQATTFPARSKELIITFPTIICTHGSMALQGGTPESAILSPPRRWQDPL